MFNDLWKMVAGLIVTVLMASPAWATDIDSKSEIESLKKRIEKLEGTHEEGGEEAMFSILTEGRSLSFWGAVEVEASYEKVEGDEESSDIALATAQLGTDIQITEQIGGHIVFLFEEDETEPIAVDEANISIHFNENLGMVLGRFYLPFGNYDSHMITDPFVLDLGETSKSAILASYGNDMFEVQFGIFNGDVDTSEDTDNIDSIVASLNVTPKEGIAAGVSYISDLTESNGEFYDAGTHGMEDNVAGIAAYVTAEVGPFTLGAEIVSALDEYEQAEVNADPDDELSDRKPSAWNLEVAMSPMEKLDAAIRYEEANNYKEELSRYGVSVAYGIFEDTILAVEYLITDPLEDSTNIHTMTTQIAMEF